MVIYTWEDVGVVGLRGAKRDAAVSVVVEGGAGCEEHLQQRVMKRRGNSA